MGPFLTNSQKMVLLKDSSLWRFSNFKFEISLTGVSEKRGVKKLPKRDTPVSKSPRDLITEESISLGSIKSRWTVPLRFLTVGITRIACVGRGGGGIL